MKSRRMDSRELNSRRALLRADSWWVRGWWICVGVWGGFGIAGARSIGIYFGLVGGLMFAIGVVVPKLCTSAGFLSVSGLSGACFYLAYLNRGGPGTVCERTATGGHRCLDAWSPVPFLVVG